MRVVIIGTIVLQAPAWSYWNLMVGLCVCSVVFGTPISVYFGCKKAVKSILDTYTTREIEISDSQA